MRIAIVSALVLLLAAPAAAATESDSAALADDPRVAAALQLLEIWIDAQIDYQDVPGASAGIVHDQNLIWSRGFGHAHPDRGVAAAPDTIYSICSISKLFTSVAVMQLRDEGLLRLDDPVAKHLEWFAIGDKYPDTGDIDIEGILTHSAGLPRESAFPYWTGPDYPFPKREAIASTVSTQEELYPADLNYQYSNLGLTLAGEVVAAVSGQPYDVYIQQKILDPLGLSSTSPEIPAQHRGDRLATPYSRPNRDGERTAIDFYQVRGVAPAAGFASTVEDLGRFASWQFRLLEKGGSEVLEATTLREMQRVHFVGESFQSYRGLGFSVSRRDGKTFVGHGGSCPGYKTNLSMSNDDKVAVIFMSNGAEVNPSSYTREMYEIIAPAIAKAQDDPGGGTPPDPQLKKYVGRYDRPLGGETHVLIVDGKLATVSVPTGNPSLTKLKHIEGNTFRRIRSDGELAEAITFEVDADGDVTRMVRNSNYSVKVR